MCYVDRTLSFVRKLDKSLIDGKIYVGGNYAIGPPPEEIVKLVRYSEKNALPLILDSDANARNVIGRGRNINRKVENVIDSTSTFVARIKQEILNISLGNTLTNRLIRNS